MNPYVNAQAFSTWLNLDHHWRHILLQGKQNNMSEWLPWLSKTEDEESHTEANRITDLAFPVVLDRLHNASSFDTQSLNQLAKTVQFFDPKAVALLRQNYHREQQQPLAFAYDWIELYQLIELSPDLLTATEQLQLSRLIEIASGFWTEQEPTIQMMDNQLFALLQELWLELPNKFKNPDHRNTNLNRKIFSMITGITNPATYFAHPLRTTIQENLEVCLNLSVKQSPEPPVPIAMSQFDSCFADFMEWGTTTASSGNLSGNLIKLDNANSINRALDLPSVQIINNLSMQAADEISCQQQLTVKSNWVEWLMAAETVGWFHDRWPGLMADKHQTDQVSRLLNIGRQLHTFPDCVNQAQPLATQFELLKTKWEKLKQEIVSHVNQYASTELRPNSDVDLFQSIDQQTNYIPENFVIKPCDVTLSCGAFATLEPSSELLKLFPNHLILAEQFGLGELEICYDQVQWQNRKATPTHLDNNKIANFEGQLHLQLNGKFESETVFTKSLLSEQRHIYLFGENNQETLDLNCPLPIVGKQINTTLDRGTYGLLPNRLTFLTAQKIDINAVMRSNWNGWQNQLSNDETGFSFFNEMNELKVTLNDAFLGHVNDLQQQIYRKLIANNSSRTNDSALSKAAFEFLTHRRLLTHMTTGLYPQLYANNPAIRTALNGQDRLVDMTFFRQSFQQQSNVVDMMLQGDENFARHDEIWNETEQVESMIHNTLLQLEQIQNFAQPQ